MTWDVLLYGLHVRADFPLPGPVPPPGATPDLRLRLAGGDPPDDGIPEGEVIAHDNLDDELWYRIVRRPDGGYLMRYRGLCDFEVDAGLRSALARPGPGVGVDEVAVFSAGGLPAFVLMMGGEPVLHASAVEGGDGAVAFAGGSGMGKSTMATLACAAGATLVTDDLLRLDVRDDAVRCYPGSDEVRLRGTADLLTGGFGVAPAGRRSGDGRQVLALGQGERGRPVLAAVVLPLADRAATATELVRLDPVNALLALSGCPRLLGWREPASAARQFQHLGDVCERVPVYTARIPWGPPFSADVVGELLGRLGVELPAS